MKNQPDGGATCPRSHRVMQKTLCGIVRFLLLLIIANLVYLSIANR